MVYCCGRDSSGPGGGPAASEAAGPPPPGAPFPGGRFRVPPGPCCGRGGAAIPGPPPPPPPPPASSSIVCGAPAGAQSQTPAAAGRVGDGGPAPTAGRGPAGRGPGSGVAAVCLPRSEQGAAGRRHYSPSSICPSHSLTLGKGGGEPRREGGREGEGRVRRDVAPPLARPPARQLGRWLAHGTPGSGRLGGRTPDNQIESGLTLDGCTEDAPRSGGGESLGHAPTPAPAPPPVFRLSTSGIPGCSRDFAERVGLELSGCLLHADIFGSGEGLAHGAGVKLGVSCPGMPDVSLSNSSRVLLNSQRIAPLSLLVTHLSSSVVAPVSLRDPGGRSPLANGPDSSDFCTSSRASPRPASLVPLQGCLF